ncbi:MAG: recombinase family protein [Velocimicrobium sp.]
MTDWKKLHNKNHLKVVVYARVSTEHEAQLLALDNQLDWYKEILNRNKEWELVDTYVDRGITGTSTTKRPKFLKMIEDSKKNKFDLIITREVSRFARNTVDALQYTRELKKNGVAVYFVSDAIHTFDSDGEMKLTFIASYAQEESRKDSERVRAGQETSMRNGVFYGNGNILGYDRIGRDFIINEEQAETVKFIYNMYNNGMGLRSIAYELEKMGKKTATGKVKWDMSSISRIIQNSFYYGLIVYKKEFVKDYLEQKKYKNNGEVEKIVTKGSHTPIVTQEEWEKANKLLSGKKKYNKGVKSSQNIWCKKLYCVCGKRFNRVKWHKDGNVTQYGYQCYGRLNHGSPEVRIKKGLGTEGVCDTPAISGWKLDAMAIYIFSKLQTDVDGIVQMAMNALKKHINDNKDSNSEEQKSKINKKIENYRSKLNVLIEMRTDGEITKNEFSTKKNEYMKDIACLQKQYDDIANQEMRVESIADRLESLETALREVLNIKMSKKIPEELIDAYFSRIVVDKNVFKWELRFASDIIEMMANGRKNKQEVICLNESKLPLFVGSSTGSIESKEIVEISTFFDGLT